MVGGALKAAARLCSWAYRLIIMVFVAIISGLWNAGGRIFFYIFISKPFNMLRHQGVRVSHLRRVSRFVLILVCINWVVPWSAMLSYRFIFTQGCKWTATRSFMEGICIQPYLQPSSHVEWYLDLWQSPQLDQGPPSVPIEMMMTGHEIICESETVLRQQMTKFHESPTGWTSGMLDSLGK